MSNIQKITVNRYYVWVDKDSEIKEGELVCGGLGGNDIKKYGKYFANDWYKIIAASPELNIEGVPTYVEWLAINEYPIAKEGGMWMPSSFDIDQSCRQNGFIKGYQTAEKELFTEDDVRKAIDMAREGLPIENPIYSEKEILEQLKQSKK